MVTGLLCNLCGSVYCKQLYTPKSLNLRLTARSLNCSIDVLDGGGGWRAFEPHKVSLGWEIHDGSRRTRRFQSSLKSLREKRHTRKLCTSSIYSWRFGHSCALGDDGSASSLTLLFCTRQNLHDRSTLLSRCSFFSTFAVFAESFFFYSLTS